MVQDAKAFAKMGSIEITIRVCEADVLLQNFKKQTKIIRPMNTVIGAAEKIK